jgi:hypothetical protein
MAGLDPAICFGNPADALPFSGRCPDQSPDMTGR